MAAITSKWVFYLEKHFPVHGVRFISVNERWDSIDGITQKDGWTTSLKANPLTNLINDAFLIDIRQKAQLSIGFQISQGGFVAPRAPYGYQKASENCHQLEIDQTAAVFVHRIFEIAQQRKGLNEVVRILNAEQIPTPAQYGASKGLTENYNQGNGLWNTRSVKKILTNITYTGMLVQGKSNKSVENTHEPIITKEVFALVQSLLAGTGAETNSAKPPPKKKTL